MTESSAMTLTLLIFAALLVGTLIIIVIGSDRGERHAAAKPGRHIDKHHRKAA